MYEVTHCALGQQLRKELLAIRQQAEPWHQGLGTALVAHAFGSFICAGILAVLWHDLRWNKDRAGLVYLLAAAFFLYVVYQIRRLVLKPLTESRKRNRSFEDFRRLMTAAETVRVEKIQADEVVSISHDDGTIYLFATGPNQCFWFEPSETPANWPNSDFEIIQIPGWNEDLGPFCRGKKIQPKASLEFREVFGDSFDPETLPADGVIQRGLNDFLAGARRL